MVPGALCCTLCLSFHLPGWYQNLIPFFIQQMSTQHTRYTYSHSESWVLLQEAGDRAGTV